MRKRGADNMEKQILMAGFGGQGILFSGKFLAHAGLIEGRQLSWLPSYGPEMRGGTANCGVILSDSPIGSPLVTKPDILAALNLPSLDRYEGDVKAGGQIYVNSSLIHREIKRRDVEGLYIPATQLASDQGLEGLANMIMVGHMLKHSGLIDIAHIEETLEQVVPASKAEMRGHNLRALRLGYEFA